jgi:arylsulfatase A-like enzyme
MNKILTSLIALLVITNMDAQQRVPKLVVCITVDQLNGEYMDYFYNTFGENGFKRLMREGVVFGNVGFEFSDIDCASSFATLFTGANPSLNGINADKRYDWEKGMETSVLEDAGYLGNYTKEHLSPARLLASTIGDELKAASLGKSDVFAIAPSAEAAVISAGHAANSAYWIDDVNGKWATTTFYKGLPWYVDRYNNGTDAISARINKMSWVPSMPVDRYTAFPYLAETTPFKYNFNDRLQDCYYNLKTSALSMKRSTGWPCCSLNMQASARAHVPTCLP